MRSPDPNTRLIVSPSPRIEKTTTAYVMVTPASRICPAGSDRANATEIPPQRPPQVKIEIVRALNSRTMLNNLICMSMQSHRAINTSGIATKPA